MYNEKNLISGSDLSILKDENDKEQRKYILRFEFIATAGVVGEMGDVILAQMSKAARTRVEESQEAGEVLSDYEEGPR
jgi:hypothetical protein